VAKYDKLAKTLSVTIPVQPPIINEKKNENENEKIIEKIESLDTNSTDDKIDDESTIIEKVNEILDKKSNSRWVGDEELQKQEKLKSELLRLEIQKQVDEAKKIYDDNLKNGIIQNDDNIPKNNENIKKTDSPSKNVTFEIDHVGDDTDYLPSKTFQGIYMDVHLC
jgi:hypothetical protein